MIDKVYEFHQRFDLPVGEEDELLDDTNAIHFRLIFLNEELNELTEALLNKDRVKAFDALLDLVYVAQGTALFMGISPEQWRAGMTAVHAANMLKVRVSNEKESKRGSSFDVRKPTGWVSPEAKLKEILK